MKLSYTALCLLCLIDDNTAWDDGRITRYWVPSDRSVSTTLPDGQLVEVYIYGGGTVASLRGLANKGLTCKMRGDHSYAITEAGRILIESLRAEARS